MERPPLGDAARSPLDPVSWSSSRYSSTADDDKKAKEHREAAIFMNVAEDQLSAGDHAECLKAADQALGLFQEMQDSIGIADVCVLKVRAHRLAAEAAGAKPAEALSLAREEIAKFASQKFRAGEARMQLVLAETFAAMSRGSKRLPKAAEAAQQALRTFQDLGDRTMEAQAQIVLCGIYFQSGKASAVREAANAALRLFLAVGPQAKQGEAKALHCIGLSHALAEEFADAVSKANEARQIYSELGFKWAEAFELQVLAQWYMALEKPAKAVLCAQEAVGIYRTLKHGSKCEAVAILLACEANIANGRARQALKLANECVAHFRGLNDQRGVAFGLEVLLHTYLFMNTPEAATKAASEALEIVRALGDKKLELNLLHAASSVHTQAFQFEDALQMMRDALHIAQNLDDPEEEAVALRTICNIHMSKGDIRGDVNTLGDILQCAKDAKMLFRASGYLSGEGSCATILATLQDSSDDMMTWAEEARVLFEKAEDLVGESSILKLMTEVRLVNDEHEQALEAADARVELWRAAGKKSQLADALYKVACIHMVEEADEQVEEAALEARKLAASVGKKALEVNICLILTQVYVLRMSREELPKDKSSQLPVAFSQAREKANRVVKDALDLACKTEDRGLRASVLFWRAEVLIWTFRGREALSSALMSDKMFAKMGHPSGQVHAQVLIADLHLMMGERERAKAVADAAMELAQSLPMGDEEEAACQALIVRIEGQKQAPVQAQQVVQEEASDAPVVVLQKAVAAAPEPKGLDLAVTTAKISELVKNVIADGEEDLPVDEPLMEAGVDSLGSVQLVTDLSKEFQMSLPPSAVFDFPTIRSLADHLVEESQG